MWWLWWVEARGVRDRTSPVRRSYRRHRATAAPWQARPLWVVRNGLATVPVYIHTTDTTHIVIL